MQNSLSLTADQPVTMTTREIAELVEKRHDNVMRTLETLYENGVIGLPQFEEVPNPGPGPLLLKQYRVGKRDSFVLVAQLSPQFTARIVDRWQELEAQQSPAIPKTLAQALRLAADQAEQIERQETMLALAAPKVEFVERYVESDTGSMGLRQVCKLLGAKQNEFTEFLLSSKIMYRTSPKGPLTPRANHVHAGRFETRTGVADHGETRHAFVQSKFSARGVNWVAGEWAKHKVQGQIEIIAKE